MRLIKVGNANWYFGRLDLPRRPPQWLVSRVGPFLDVVQFQVSIDGFKIVSPWMVLLVMWHRPDSVAQKWHEHGTSRAFAVGLLGGYVEFDGSDIRQVRAPYWRRLPARHRIRTTPLGWLSLAVVFGESGASKAHPS